MSTYRGRFAPSPTGPLHFGSLVAALASYLDARANQGEWIVRMEDVDLPRCVPGADTLILRTLETFGLNWDGPVIYQSERTEAYEDALAQLVRDGVAYPCSCSRKDIGGIYPGTCRESVRDPSKPLAWRIRVEGDLSRETGDFVVKRSDGLFAYQLAVVVDDAHQGITDIVRGADLLDSTPRQIWLQTKLGYPTPRYQHIPIATNEHGEKLSKQTRAQALDPARADELLREAMAFLGHEAPPQLPRAEFLNWATSRWRESRDYCV